MSPKMNAKYMNRILMAIVVLLINRVTRICTVNNFGGNNLVKGLPGSKKSKYL